MLKILPQLGNQHFLQALVADMAVARQVQVAAGEDGLVAVQRDIIVDPERGIAAEVEKVVVAVDVGDGKIAVMEQNRVKSVTDLPSVSYKAHALDVHVTFSHPHSLALRELSLPPAGTRLLHATRGNRILV